MNKIDPIDKVEYLYCPIRLGDCLHVERHKVVKQGEMAIYVDPIPDGWTKDGHRGPTSLVKVYRYRIYYDGWSPRRYEGRPDTNDFCPFGRFYLTEEGARFALQLWIGFRYLHVRTSRRRNNGMERLPSGFLP